MDRITSINRTFVRRIPWYFWVMDQDLPNLSRTELWRAFNRLSWGDTMRFRARLEPETFNIKGKNRQQVKKELMIIAGYGDLKKEECEDIKVEYD